MVKNNEILNELKNIINEIENNNIKIENNNNKISLIKNDNDNNYTIFEIERYKIKL